MLAILLALTLSGAVKFGQDMFDCRSPLLFLAHPLMLLCATASVVAPLLIALRSTRKAAPDSVPIDTVLASPVAVAKFKDFLEREFCVENLTFYFDAESCCGGLQASQWCAQLGGGGG
jgi:hypothetical protein